MRLIIFTGTPGTGKTALAMKLAERNSFLYIDLNKFIEERQLHEGYDSKRKCYVVDTQGLNRKFLTAIKSIDAKAIVVDSHLSHYLPASEVELCVVTTCSELKLLKQRLEARGYTASKIRENLDAEIFKVCLVEATEQGHNVVEVDTCNNSIMEGVMQIESCIL